MTGDCRHCKDFRECVPPEWFNYAEIRFCVHQIMWVIRNAGVIGIGKWPDDSQGDNNSGSKVIKTEASFVKPILILAEVESRLGRTGIHGKLLVAQIEAGRELNTLDREARDALFYVQGWKQKRITFNEWKKARRYYQKGNKAQKEEENAVPVC